MYMCVCVRVRACVRVCVVCKKKNIYIYVHIWESLNDMSVSVADFRNVLYLLQPGPRWSY